MLKARCKQSIQFVRLVYFSNGIDIFRPVTLVQKTLDSIELQKLNHDVGAIVGCTCAAARLILAADKLEQVRARDVLNTRLRATCSENSKGIFVGRVGL